MRSEAAAKLELWFFRDMLESNRLRLFELFGFKPSEMDTMAKQQMVFRRILDALSTDAEPGTVLKNAIRAVSEAFDPSSMSPITENQAQRRAIRSLNKLSALYAEPVKTAPAVAVTEQIIQKLRVTGFRGNPLRVVLSNGTEADISQKFIDSFASPSPFEQHDDDVAVDRFAKAMKAKLAEKRADGAGGWDDPEVCHIDYLAHLLKEQIHSRAALDTIDIGNFAMMIFNRGETPSHGR